MKYSIVGIVFFITLFIGFYFTIIERVDYKNLYPYKLRLYYSRIDGIKQGTEVFINGVQLGIVESLEVVTVTDEIDRRYLDNAKKYAIELTIILSEPVTLWEDYVVRFRTKTVFSGRSIEIEPGTNPILSLSKKHIQNPSAAYFEDIFLASNEIMRENQTDLRKSIQNIGSITHKLNTGSGTLPLLIRDDSVYCSIDNLVADISIVGKEARWYAEGIRETDTILTGFLISTTLLIFNLNIFF
jgi:ABC-type transporter Mla subunit MlaD